MKKAFMIIAGVLACGTSAAQANTVSGKLWHVSEAASQSAVPANVPVSPPDITFDVNSPIQFSASGATVNTWLNSSGAFNVAENTGGTLASLMDNGSVGSIVEFTGTVAVTNGQQFKVTHDDGLTLIIGGNNLGFSSGPTSPVTSTATYSGPTGTFPFQLVYGECCGGPAVLQVDLPFTSPVPEPEIYAMLLSGLGLLGFIRRRRKS